MILLVLCWLWALPALAGRPCLGYGRRRRDRVVGTVEAVRTLPLGG